MKAFTLLFFAILVYACQDVKPAILTYEEACKNCKSEWIILENGDTLGMTSKPDCIHGALLPSFSAKTINDVVIDSTYFADKVSVINFWFIGCKPCEEEMPAFNKLVENYKNESVQFLAISRNSPTHVNEFLAEHPFNFEQIAYGEPLIRGNFQHNWGYPFTIVADKNSKIIYVKDGGSAIEKVEAELTAVIDKALKG